MPDAPAVPSRRLAIFEGLLIFAVLFLFAGWPPPSVNEAHYLAKAKHYWNPAWCAGDLFLESADVHLSFYWMVGPLTKIFSLATVAWLGRVVMWLALAWAWQRLSTSLVPLPLFSALSAAAYVLLTERLHMSGEWVVGGLEAKGFAYAAVFAGLAALTRGRWLTAYIYWGIAATFHVLVGGWSLVASGVVWLVLGKSRPPLQRVILGMGIAVVLATPGWLPALGQNWNLPAELLQEANRIYVYERLWHHLVFHRFPHLFMLRHGLLVVLWAFTAWSWRRDPAAHRLNSFVAGAATIAVLGILIDQATLYRQDLAAHWLRFYWFRLSDAIVPLGVVFNIGLYLLHWRDHHPARFAGTLVAALLATATGFGARYWQESGDLRPAAFRAGVGASPDSAEAHAWFVDWLRVCRWVELETAPTEVLVTPRSHGTFKWYAGRPEFFNWKDMPQDAESLRAWWARRRLLYPRADDPAARLDPEEYWPQVVEGLRAEGVRYWLVEQGLSPPAPFYRVYPSPLQKNAHYAIYRLPAESESP